MLKTVLAACALLCALTINADARQRAPNPAYASCIPTSDVMRPCAYQPDFLAGVRSIRVVMKRERRAKLQGKLAGSVSKEITPSFSASIARPLRYIAGRLICAINVNVALAERGIRGTGSALAHSFDGWGIRVARPIPGAVAVTDRRGGGHVAIVSRIEGSRVFVWNPSPRGRGWREVEYTNRHARYRVAG